MKEIIPGVFADYANKSCEFDVPTIMAHCGIPDTEENRDAVVAALLKIQKERIPECKQSVARKCPICKGAGRVRHRVTCENCGGKGQAIEDVS